MKSFSSSRVAVIMVFSLALGVSVACSAASRVSLQDGEFQKVLENGFRFEIDTSEGAQFESMGVDFDAVDLVGLGEASHGTSEFHSVRHMIFRHLVENKGYRLFLLEDQVASLAAFQRVFDSDAPIEEAMAQLHFKGTWATTETREMFLWARNFNKDHPSDPIRFYGVDTQNLETNTYGLEQLEQLRPELSSQIKTLTQALRDLGVQLKDLMKACQPNENCMLAVELMPDLLKALESARSLRTLLMNSPHSQTENEVLELSLAMSPHFFLQKLTLEIGEQTGSRFLLERDSEFTPQMLFDTQCLQSSWSCRDFGMATIATMILKITVKKGIFYGHNGHIARFLSHPDIAKWVDSDPDSSVIRQTAGSFLTESLGDRYYPIILDFHRGSFLARDASIEDQGAVSWSPDPVDFGSDQLQSVLSSGSKDTFAINLRPYRETPIGSFFDRIHAIRAITALFSPEWNRQSYMMVKLPAYADGYIFIGVTTAHTPLGL